MRILQANKFFYPKGGADKYFLDLTAALKKAGHETAVFAMANPKNLESPDAKYFVSQVEFNGGSLKDKLKVPGRMIYSLEAKRKFTQEINDFRPDIVHVHNIYHQLSPSILKAAKSKGIPVVMHLHDYKLICPNYRLFTNNEFCRRCLDKKSYWPCFFNNCYQSYPKSFLASLEMTIHHKFWHIYQKNIDMLIAPSEFMRNLVIDSGWPADKIITVYNPAKLVDSDIQPGDPSFPEEDYLLYFGRLSSEKGITDLVKAASATGKTLHLIGSGPERKNIRQTFKQEIKAGRLKLLGRLGGGFLAAEISRARAIVIPSTWPENMPLTLLESLSQAKLVIASRIGGIPEIIKDGENGFLFEAGNIQNLEETIKKVYGLAPDIRQKIKQKALETAQIFDPKRHLQEIIKIYSKLAKKSE